MVQRRTCNECGPNVNAKNGLNEDPTSGPNINTTSGVYLPTKLCDICILIMYIHRNIDECLIRALKNVDKVSGCSALLAPN